MKKIICILTAFLLAISLCSCKKEKPKVYKSENISDIKLYIDDSYIGEDYLIYTIYTVTATKNDVEFLYYLQNELSWGSSATATIDEKNTYSDLFAANSNLYKPFEITTLKSPCEGQIIKAGESSTLISAFFIPKNDFNSGKKFILTLTAKNNFEEAREFPIANALHINSATSLAREISPDGLTSEEKAALDEVAEIDEILKNEITNALSGIWEYTENNIKKQMIFKDGNFTHNKLNEKGKSALISKGSFSVRKKVILVTLKDETILKIPYTYENKKLTLSPPKESE